jgi:DNA-directed RNA polymerase specialized sigma subunit
MLSNVEREKLVIDLYYNQRKNVRQIAQEARISFRGIAAILKKKEEAAAINDGDGGNGIAAVDNQQQQIGNGSSQSNQKSTQDYDHLGREMHVIELYKQGKSTRDIAKELRMSLRDISIILKKHGVNHGIAMIDDDDNKKSHSNNEKATQAYNLFSEEKKPVQLAIELGLREKQVDKLYREFWKLKNLNELYEIYAQIQHCLPSFLKLHKALKKRNLNPNNVEWFADAIETGAIKIPEILLSRVIKRVPQAEEHA